MWVTTVRTHAHSVPEPILALPNLLTLIRLPLAALLWVKPGMPVFTLSVMVAAALTDAVDGRVARALRRRYARRRGDGDSGDGTSPVGAWLDPACDKVFVLSAVGAVSWAAAPPLTVVVLIAIREIGVIPPLIVYRLFWHRRLQFDFRAGVFGKITTVAQFGAIAAMLAAPALMWPLATVCGGAGVLAIADYFYRGWRISHAVASADSVS